MMNKQGNKMSAETKDVILACITGGVIGTILALTYIFRTGGF